MAEPYGDREPGTRQNPPDSVVNRGVRRTALSIYLGPIVILFAIVGIAFLYWATRPPRQAADETRGEPRAEGTAGVQPPADRTPGGRSPDAVPETAREEIEQRGGAAITELGEVLEEHARGTIGRRIEIRDVDVERVESPTLFWIRDGNARIAVVSPGGSPSAQPGRSVSVFGTVERAGDTVRIRASRVESSR